MLYLDTSAIVKLYIKEDHSSDVSLWLKQNDEALPLTSFHDLEFNNALRLKQFRGEITEEVVQGIIQIFISHQSLGIFYRPPIDWPAIFKHAHKLSSNYTGSIGSRSLDILHVASALSIDAEYFLTFDERQSNLAVLNGIKIVSV